MQYSLEDIHILCTGVGFGDDAAWTMAAIALAESNGIDSAECHDCVPGVHENSYGLYQINLDAWGDQYTAQCLLDPICATGAAYAISKHGTDFTPWSTYKSKAYLQFLPPSNVVNKGYGTGGNVDPLGKIKDAGSKITGLGGADISQDDVKKALITLALLGAAGALVFGGLISLAAEKAAPVIIPAAKTAAKAAVLV